MKRLIRKAEEQQQQQNNNEQYDDFLGQRVEVVYPKSKYVGYRGYVDNKMRPNGKYRVFLEPQNFENTQNYHEVYITPTEAQKWLRVLHDEDEYQEETEQ